MTYDQELDVYLRARFTLIVLVTPEEERALRAVRALCERRKRPGLSWDVADGFQWLGNADGAVPKAKDALTALEQIDKADGEGVYVLKDFHESWTNGPVKRRLRSVAQRLKSTNKSILITTPTSKVPEELRDDAVAIVIPPPTANDLEDLLNRI